MVYRRASSHISPRWVVKIYLILLCIIMAMLLFLSVFSEIATYRHAWIEGAIGTVLHLVELTVGAVIGALTTAASMNFGRKDA